MSTTITATASGSSPLVSVRAVPFDRENLSVRGFRVDAVSSGTVQVSTGFRLGQHGLLSLDSTGSRSFRGAVRDANGLWSEYSASQVIASSNYTAGSTEASIGSGSVSDIALQSGGIVFPDLSQGSGRMTVRKTLVATGWTDEVRSPRWSRGIAAFHVILSILDPDQTALLHRFWRAVNGSRSLFFFDYVDPAAGTRTTGTATRYVVRFRDPALVSRLFDVTFSEVDFYLIEQQDEPEGGDC